MLPEASKLGLRTAYVLSKAPKVAARLPDMETQATTESPGTLQMIPKAPKINPDTLTRYHKPKYGSRNP